MKKIFLAIVVLMFLYSSCKKDDDIFWGNVSANMNGNSWNTDNIYATPNLPFDQGIDILIYELDDQGFIKYNLYIYKIPIQGGTYHLDSTEVRDIDTLVGAVLYKQDDDVTTSAYSLIEDGTEINELVIEEIEGDKIKGTFDISFVKKADTPFNSNDPDTVIFKNGVFETKIVED